MTFTLRLILMILASFAFSYAYSQTEDLDNDGVFDQFDLDDDNDGILDTDECGFCEEPIINGDFEDPDIPGGFSIMDSDLVLGWSTTESSGQIEIWSDGFNGVPAYSGNQFAELNANNVSILFQEICIPPGATVEWSVAHRGRSGEETALVKIGGSFSTGVLQETMVDGTDAWGEYSGTYTVPDNQQVTVFMFESVVPSGSVGNFLDAIVISYQSCDTDQDGIPNIHDLDSDADGCSDVIESGGSDSDSDGIIDGDGINSEGQVTTGGNLIDGYDGLTGSEYVAHHVYITSEPEDQGVEECESVSFEIEASADSTDEFSNGSPIYSEPGNADEGLIYDWYIGGASDAGGQLISNSSIEYTLSNDASVLTINDVVGLNGTEVCVVVSHEDHCFSEENCATLSVLSNSEIQNSVSICEGESHSEGSSIYTSSGTYTDAYTSLAGCDSIITTELTVHPAEVRTNVVEICAGETYTEQTSSYTSTGTYTDTYQTVHGCDSVVTTELTVHPQEAATNVIEICAGETYTEQTSSYISTGTYTDTYQTVHGCDSVVTTELTVHPHEAMTNVVEICAGETYTEQTSSYTSAGIYTDTYQTVYGCDSVVTSDLTVHPHEAATNVVEICAGETYTEQTSSYTSTGIYTDTYQTVNGCDSVVTTDLTVHPIEASTNVVEICAGETYYEQTSSYTSTGTYADTYQTVHGCDSVVTTELTVHPIEEVTNVVEICAGETYEEQASVYMSTGIYTDTYESIHGCDSIVTTDLTVHEPISVEVIDDQTTCPGSEIGIWAEAFGGSGGPYSYYWIGLGSGAELNISPHESTTYSVYVIDSLGCQSPMASTHIEVIRIDDDEIDVLASESSICQGESISVEGIHTGPQDIYHYQWSEAFSNELGPFQHAPLSDTWIILTVSDTCSNTVQDSVFVSVMESPEVQVQTIEETGCMPYEVSFEEVGDHPAGTSYIWDFGNGDTAVGEFVDYTFTEEGEFSYGLSIEYPNGCSLNAQNMGQVYVALRPEADFAASSLFVDELSPTVQFTSLSSNDAIFFEWDFGQGEVSNEQHPSSDFNEDGAFFITLTVENEYGCTDMTSSVVQRTPVHEIIIPNAFTPSPNGSSDGAYNINALDNDIFFPWTDHVSRFEMLIYNRWGELLFKSTDIAHGWNGMYQGQMSQQDVYIYRIMVTYNDGMKADEVGNVTLYR